MNNKELIEYLKSTNESLLPVGTTTENRLQDFKEELDISNNTSKGKFLKHIIAFANTGGKQMSCIYYGIKENKEDKKFEICGVESNRLHNPDTIKDIIKTSIYPPVNVDVIIIYNEKLFPENHKAIQIIKIENNSNRPYRFKQTISKKDGFVEGLKYYRDNHSSNPIPATQEDEMIKKWIIEDAGLVKRTIKNLELLGLIAVVADFFSRVPEKYIIKGYSYSIKSLIITSLLLTIILFFFERFLGAKINKLYKYYSGILDNKEASYLVVFGNSIKLILSFMVFLFYEIFFLVFLLISVNTGNIIGCSRYNYCEADFTHNLLAIIFTALTLSAMLIPFIPLIGRVVKSIPLIGRAAKETIRDIWSQSSGHQ